MKFWNITGILLVHYWNITASAATLRLFFDEFLITVRVLVTAKMAVILLSPSSSRSHSNVMSPRLHLDKGKILVLVMSTGILGSNQ